MHKCQEGSSGQHRAASGQMPAARDLGAGLNSWIVLWRQGNLAMCLWCCVCSPAKVIGGLADEVVGINIAQLLQVQDKQTHRHVVDELLH